MKLFAKLKVDPKHLTEDDIGFTISPRINAASRMGVPMEAFRLLSTDDEIEAERVSAYLNQINDERKGIVGSMVKEMHKIIEARSANESMRNVIVMGNPLWKPALLGLAANSLMEAHSRPVFLWGREGEGTFKGSCRSDGSVDVLLLMSKTLPGVFAQFGGHKMAAGFTISNEKIHFLEEEIAKAYEAARQERVPESIFIDKKLSLDDINWETYRQIEQLAPFGVGNPKPLFLFSNAEVKDFALFGKESNHLRIDFEKAGGKKVSAIAFFTTSSDFGVTLQKGSRINLVATMEKSMFRNFPELRLRIVDLL